MHVDGDGLEMRGKATRTIDPALDGVLLRRVGRDKLETACDHEVFEVPVPAAATVETLSVGCVPVAV